MFVKSPNSQSKSLLAVKRTKHNLKKKLKLIEENETDQKAQTWGCWANKFSLILDIPAKCAGLAGWMGGWEDGGVGGWVALRCLQTHQHLENNKAHKGSTLPTNTAFRLTFR